MSDGQLQDVVHFLRRVVAPGGMGGVSDAELLERFVRNRDEAAFELLVWRHGKMVLGVCRRLLRQEQDAEDAFQAAFLTLARRAGVLGRRASVGGWLYRVAFRIALRARAAASRRTRREQSRPARQDGVADPAEEAAQHELRQVIDEEVNRLPEKYRVPFVLCHLGGRSNAEAARELGCPVGTLESWLARARRRLRGGLTRRGVALPAGLFAVGLGALAAPAEVSAALIGPTARAAVLVATGQATVGLISTQATAWAEGALRTMYVSKLKIATVVLLTAGLAGTGVGGLSFRPATADQTGRGERITSAPRGEDAGRIGRLIRQLGSDRFADREKATKELDKIGAPALDALREAVQSRDPEVRRRAGELASKIEERTESEEVLLPKRVHLIYKDTPLLEALGDFQRKCGYSLSVREADGKLKERTVTLDTGEVTFWEALDLFCKVAGLVEAGQPTPVAQGAAMPRMMPPGNFGPVPQLRAAPGALQPPQPGNPFRPAPGAVRPGGALPKMPAPPADGAPVPPGLPAPPGRSVTVPAQPAQPAGAAPQVPALQPVPPGAGPAAPAPAAEAPGQPAVVPGAGAETVPAQPALPAGPAPQAPVFPGGPPGQPVPPPPGLPAARPGIQAPLGGDIHRTDSPSGPITLRDGPWQDAPTVQVGALRLRLLKKVFRPVPRFTDNFYFALQIAAEPKVGWRKAMDLRIDKAVDDRGQELTEAPAVVPLEIDPTQEVVPTRGSLMPLRLKKGEKPAKTLKELRGRLTAEVVPVKAKTILTVENVLKSDSTEFKLPGGGALEIVKSNSLPQGVTYGGKASAKERANWVSILVKFHEMPAPSDDQATFELTLLGDEDDSGKRSRLAKVPSFVGASDNGMLLFYGPLPKAEKSSFQLVLGRRRKITVTVPFTFKDVPLP